MRSGADGIDGTLAQLAADVAPLGGDWAGMAQARFSQLWQQWQSSSRQLQQALSDIASTDAGRGRGLRGQRAVGRVAVRALTVRPPSPYDTSGAVWVRPPALVEAAAGVRASARVVEECATAVSRSLAGCVAFGGAQAAYGSWAGAWAAELALLARETARLSDCVEATAVDYVRTDAAAAGAG